MKRWILHVFTGLSAFFFICTVILWPRSYFYEDKRTHMKVDVSAIQMLMTDPGSLLLIVQLGPPQVGLPPGGWEFSFHSVNYADNAAKNARIAQGWSGQRVVMYQPRSEDWLVLGMGATYKNAATGHRILNVGFPFWLMTLIFAVLPARATWRLVRHRQLRIARGLCGTCGYNLTGNLSGVCPECGTAIPPKPEPKGATA